MWSLIPQALAPSTRANYKRSYEKIASFACEVGFQPSFPISIQHACMFLVFLYNKKKISPASLLTIMSGLGYFHKIVFYLIHSFLFLSGSSSRLLKRTSHPNQTLDFRFQNPSCLSYLIRYTYWLFRIMNLSFFPPCFYLPFSSV